MKKYMGTKEVYAQPMRANEAINMGYKVNGHDGDGYEVVYEDGYKSWSPKEVFEKAYKPADTALERVDVERVELENKLHKGRVFLNSEKSNALSPVGKAMLSVQLSIMEDYVHLLCYRSTLMETGIGGDSMFSFCVAIKYLKNGMAIRRSGWNGKNLMVFKQVPAHIEGDIIPKMQSLPKSAKELIGKGKNFIDYTSQCLIYNRNTGLADSWVPSISDVFAEDWELVME